MEAVLGRRSRPRLTEPAPDDAELLDLVGAALTAPDHARLAPWRLVTLRGEDREALGARFAASTGGDRAARDRAAGKPLRAPLLVTVVFCPKDHAKVPEWEQLASAAAAVHTLLLLLHGNGWGAIWRTGHLTEDRAVRRLLGVEDGERLLGWLYVGTPAGTVPPRPNAAPGPRVRPFRHLRTEDAPTKETHA
ncbi:nitroreductase [Kitasatospora sp. NPDC101157]|uniref:nitroreductase family protein n=1 Tax=Kitasatospora sp. NPDC101157 TaxID=3364098 RepID=UPI003808A4BD